MNVSRIVIKKNSVGPTRYSHYACFVGASSSPIAWVNKTIHGYQVFDLDENGKGLHDTRDRVKLAVIERVLHRN